MGESAAMVVRASDRERERTVALLEARCGDGYLSVDTFSDRIDRAFRARTRDELRALTFDVPAASLVGEWLRRLRRRLATAAIDSAQAPAPELPPLTPPASEDGTVFLVGRSHDCDLLLDDPTVSSRHAELRREDGRWMLKDLGSLNGIRVNGWRVHEAGLGEGDEVLIGGLRLRFHAVIASRISST